MWGDNGLRVGAIVSVTKAKPKVGQWWQGAYVHGRGAAAAGGQLLLVCWDTPGRNPPGPPVGPTTRMTLKMTPA